MKAGLMETDEALAEVMGSTRLGVGSASFLRKIRESYDRESRRRVKEEDVSFRRGKRVVEPQAVVAAV